MRRARHALDMADPTGVPVDADKLAVAAEELADLKGVWQALTPIYTSIDEMKVTGGSHSILFCDELMLLTHGLL